MTLAPFEETPAHRESTLAADRLLQVPSMQPGPFWVARNLQRARSGQITYREVQSMPSSTPLTLVLVNDYTVVVEGLKPVLTPLQ
jgi:hypothetical protein